MLGKRYVVDSVAEAFDVVGYDLLSEGIISSPRGNKTLELIAPQIVITDPTMKLAYNKERNFNIFHALNESMLLFSSSNRVEDIAEFNKNMALYSDDGKTMYGSYGRRIAGFIEVVVAKLKADNDTRQAVLTIYHSNDMVAHTKDVPCTSTLQFFIRQGKLHMITTMRSNDILFGFQFDVVMFTNLQQAIANSLGIPVGTYIHQPGSLHVYKDYPKFDGFDMLSEMRQSTPIRFNNTGTVLDWMHLAHNLRGTKAATDYGYRGTIKEVFKLISYERLYRAIKDDGNIDNVLPKQVFRDAYNESPDWAKPFLQKWNKEMN